MTMGTKDQGEEIVQNAWNAESLAGVLHHTPCWPYILYLFKAGKQVDILCVNMLLLLYSVMNSHKWCELNCLCVC